MSLIVVFHFTEKGRLPKLTKEQLSEIRGKFLEVLKDYPDVTFTVRGLMKKVWGYACGKLQTLK